MNHVLIVGTSTRAAAESAARAGFRVTAIDAYADRDQHPSVRALSASRGSCGTADAGALRRAALSIDCDAVIYLSPFENHPRAVHALRAGRTLWGNTPATLRRVRNPRLLFGTLARLGFAVPQLSHVSNDPNDPNDRNDPNDPNDPNDVRVWLVKPLRSGGGHGIRSWRGEVVADGNFLQERIDGTPGSVVFVADGRETVALGISRQLVGDANFGAAGYRYCGSIIAPVEDRQFARGREVIGGACALAACVTREFGLIGVNGIDFVERGGIPYPVEVNPRWSSSMELVEHVIGRPLLQLHAAACRNGGLPSPDTWVPPSPHAAFGKAVVFARESGRVGETDSWLADPTVRDVPRSGEVFGAGQPVCTVLATARDSASCYRRLVERAAGVYAGITAVREVECHP